MKSITRALAPLLLATLTTSVSARAQSTAGASQQLFEDGSALLKAGKVHEACAKFDESQKLQPELGTLLNLASCHEREGKTATAWTEYTELADLAAKKGDTRRAAYAKKQVAEIEPQMPRLQLTVPAETSELKLDGVVLGQAAWNVALPIDPGDHTIDYTAPSKKPGTVRVTAVKGQLAKTTLPPLENMDGVAAAPIAVTAPPIQASPAPAPTPPVESQEPVKKSHGSPLRTAGYIVGGAGVIGVGVGAVFGLVALGDKSNVTNNCVGTQCSQAGLDAVDAARRDATISTITFVAGGVCLAAGVTMVLLSGKKSSQVGLMPLVRENGGGLVGFGRF